LIEYICDSRGYSPFDPRAGLKVHSGVERFSTHYTPTFVLVRAGMTWGTKCTVHYGLRYVGDGDLLLRGFVILTGKEIQMTCRVLLVVVSAWVQV